MTKAELRRNYLQKRRSLTSHELTEKNKALTTQFFTLIDKSNIKVVHLYLPIQKNNEPDTRLIINQLQHVHPQIRISIPRIVGNTLEHYNYEDESKLKTNEWGIDEPTSGSRTLVEEIDMVIVPLLVFSTQLHRVGYGKGYYDRFLSSCRSNCRKIGLSFFEPVNTISDITENDIPLDQVITPEKIY